MRIAVLHALFDIAGGAEKLALELARALDELGYDVEILTFYRDRSILERNINLLAPGRKPRVVAKPVPLSYRFLDVLSPGRFVRLKRLLAIKSSLKNVKKEHSYDLVFETCSNTPLNVDVSYIHFPVKIIASQRLGKSFAYRLYHSIVERYAMTIEGEPRLVFTNSSWTAKKILETYPEFKGKVHVLYPTVDIEYFNEVADRDRENLVVTVSRFTPEKGLDKILDVAAKMRDYKFVLAGSAERYSKPVLEDIERRVEKEGLDNVELLVNTPRDKLRELLGRAKYYLHPPYAEHFGIAVVEAMAAGCIPIVYRDGGAWFDIASRVSDILGYSDVNEVPGIIRRIESDRVLYEELKNKSISVSKEFNYERFKSELSKYMNYLLETRIHS